MVLSEEVRKNIIFAAVNKSDMATIILSYDECNPVAQKTLGYLKSIGIFKVQKQRKTSIDEAMEDIEKGRIYRIINRRKSTNE
jgi:hypothetical protein